MAKGLKNPASSFFAHKLTSQVKELYTSALILNFASSMVNIFEPVFVYLIFIQKYSIAESLHFVLLFYLAVYVIYFFILPLGAKFARRFGYEHSIATSAIFNVLFYIGLFGMQTYFELIYLVIVSYALYKTFYWPAYHSDFARFSADGERGRQISNLVVLSSFVYIVGPLIGGAILAYFGFKVLFVVVVILSLISNVPLLMTKEEFEPRPFSYFDSYKRIFKKKYRRKFLAHFGFGEELIGLVIWPIFIYVVIGDFLKLGLLVAISITIATFVYLYVGKITDKSDRKAVLKVGTIVFFFSWLFRVFTRSVLGVFLVDSYARVSRQIIAIPFTAATYKKARDTDVMTGVVFFEMSLVVGKIVTMILALLLLMVFAPGWNAMFVLGGLMTLLYLLF